MIIDLDQARHAASEFDKYERDGFQLYKDVQRSKMSVSEYFESIDPSPRDEYGNIASPCDAFERHLMIKNIQLKGTNQVSVEYVANNVEYLMAEMVLREIKAGMAVKEQFDYRDCLAATVPAKGATYHPLYIPDQDNATANQRRDHSLGGRAASAKGGEFPRMSIRRREKDIVIQDNGRVIEAAYSVVKNYSWADFAVFLRLIGGQLASDKLQNVYDLGITGDGTVGAATDTFGGTAGTLAYTDLITNVTSFNAPFECNRMLGPAQSVRTILAMAQFQDPLAGWEYQKTGKMVSPMGAKLKQVNDTPGAVPVGTVMVTLDKNFAAKEVVNEVLAVEADKIIARKFEEAVVSEASSLVIVADGALRRIVWT